MTLIAYRILNTAMLALAAWDFLMLLLANGAADDLAEWED